jgi:hypothetical protein
MSTYDSYNNVTNFIQRVTRVCSVIDEANAHVYVRAALKLKKLQAIICNCK